MSKLRSNIEKIIEYGMSLVGTPYRSCYNVCDITKDKAPFWASNEKMPSLRTIRREGCNCTGLLNLMRRSVSLPIPPPREGFSIIGTDAWFLFLHSRDKLEVFDCHKQYPRGTLLLSRYLHDDAQGHLAVVVQPDLHDTYQTHILHCWTLSGVTVEELGLFQFTQRNLGKDNSSFTHACLPQHWLLT